MREITLKDGKVQIPIPEQRVKFLSQISCVKFDGWEDKDTAYIILDQHDLETLNHYFVFLQSLDYYKEFSVVLSDELREFYKELQARVEEERAKKYEEEKRLRDIENAKNRMKNGCGWCSSLSRKGRTHICDESGKECDYDEDEKEMAFEGWKESGFYQTPTPFPNAECPYRKILEELKNGRKEQQSLVV